MNKTTDVAAAMEMIRVLTRLARLDRSMTLSCGPLAGVLSIAGSLRALGIHVTDAEAVTFKLRHYRSAR